MNDTETHNGGGGDLRGRRPGVFRAKVCVAATCVGAFFGSFEYPLGTALGALGGGVAACQPGKLARQKARPAGQVDGPSASGAGAATTAAAPAGLGQTQTPEHNPRQVAHVGGPDLIVPRCDVVVAPGYKVGGSRPWAKQQPGAASRQPAPVTLGRRRATLSHDFARLHASDYTSRPTKRQRARRIPMRPAAASGLPCPAGGERPGSVRCARTA